MNLKNTLILWLLFWAGGQSIAQKWDAVWMFGTPTPAGDSLYLHTRMDFNHNPVKISGVVKGGVNFTTADISTCDAQGVLQFYSDKCFISGAKGWPPVPGGESLWNNLYDSLYCAAGTAIGMQSILSLPAPDSAGQYMVLYYGYGPVEGALLQPLYLYSARVDMRLNNGGGQVLDKHRVVLGDTLGDGYLQAVRHANGRDWWIVVPEAFSNCYYTLLLTPAGITTQFRQCAGVNWGAEDGQGQAVFSPDGRWYARINPVYGLNLFQFDRCAGTLSAVQQIHFENNFTAGGVAVSENSRYLYATTTKQLWQFDLQSADPESSKTLIDTYDGAPFPEYGVFYLSYLAPDHKIYIAGISSHKHLHVIESPDSAGPACDFRQHGIEIPTYNYVGLPNNPYFRLGAASEPCDSATTTFTAPPQNPVRLYPRLVTDRLYVDPGQNETVFMDVFNAAGGRVFSAELNNRGETEIGAANWSAGIYFCLFHHKNGAQIEKIVKVDP